MLNEHQSRELDIVQLYDVRLYQHSKPPLTGGFFVCFTTQIGRGIILELVQTGVVQNTAPFCFLFDNL